MRFESFFVFTFAVGSVAASFTNIDAAESGTTIPWPASLPVYDHIVIVVEENKNYEDIISSPLAPYINGVLKAEGASFTRIFGEEHNSQGNYFWMFSGSNQTIGFMDRVPNESNHPGYPFSGSNLGCQLIKKGRSFKGYSEGLPAIGFSGDASPDHSYARKHVPWISFSNVPNGTTIQTSSNLRFDDFPTDRSQFKTLPTVSFVIPNLKHDMHDGRQAESVPKGDQWLKRNLDAYYQWAKTNNSLLIVTFDENDNKQQYRGLTNPFVASQDEFRLDLQNRIATIFAGAHIKPGDYDEGAGITHVNVLRTIESMYGLPKSGSQQPNAAGGGIGDDVVITDVFMSIK